MAVVPIVVGGFGAEELGGDVGAGLAGDFVAEFEVHHQAQEFGAHGGVFFVLPDGGEVGAGEFAPVLVDVGIAQDFVDGIGAPGGFEDDGFMEEVVGLEVEADAEVVEVAAELEFVGVAGKAVVLANL